MLIDILLGLIGGGGSMLTVPVLVCLFGIEAALATTCSPFIACATSMAGAISCFIGKRTDIKIGLVFGAPSIIMGYLVRTFLMPAIPDKVAQPGNFTVAKWYLSRTAGYPGSCFTLLFKMINSEWKIVKDHSS